MNRLAQDALIARLARTLREQDSWTGETHIQKATYLLSDLELVPFDFDFILYKHGPFSFELRDEIGEMQADHYLVREAQLPPYGPRFAVTGGGEELERRFERTMERYGPRIDWIAEQLRGKGVAALERLATALWVSLRQSSSSASIDSRAAELRRIKRHVTEEKAIAATRDIDKIIADATVLTEGS
jgi:hypothetical protein